MRAAAAPRPARILGEVRIASLVVVVAVSACAPVAVPAAREPEPAPAPQLRLVGCAPAAPLPRTATDVAVLAPITGDDEFGAAGYTAVRSRPAGAPRVIAGEPTVTGPLDRSVVERLVRGRLVQLRACYERELAATPEMTGTVTVQFLAGPDGRIATTSVLGSGVSPAVSACAVQVVQTLQFPTGQPISVSYPFQFVVGGEASEPPAAAPIAGPRPGAPWTPFALGDDPPPRIARQVARATEGAIRGRLAAIAGCFTGPAPIGSLRAMLAVRGDGTIDGARAGGLGDAVEACVARRLAELRVLTPGREPTEVACDFARGEARPWRIAPASGYTVLEAARHGVRFGDDLVTPGVVAPRPLPADQTFLVITHPDTPGAMLELALEWAEQGDATLIALADEPRAPLVVGTARTAHQIGGLESATAWPALRVGKRAVTACVDRASQAVAAGDPAAIDDLVRRLATRCRGLRCSGSLGVAIDGDASASQLAEVAGAARRAGFERVLLGSYTACQPVRQAPR
jgi:hypothetical protein